MDNTCEAIGYPLASVIAKMGGNLNIYNSCIYGNDGYQVAIDTDDGNLGSIINISHSLIQDTTWVPVLSNGVHSEVNWLGGILECDPMLDDDYIPIEGSPLIDAGTLGLPYDIELPETDVYGNPRIYGNGIDIGAVEWQGTGMSQEEIVQSRDDIIIYPNPLIAGSLRDGMAKILWSGEDSGEEIYFEIFNIKGQRIYKCKIENVRCKIKEVSWDLCDDGGNPVSSGIYFIRVKSGADYLAQKKLTVVN
jgi:hypothetical protein